MNEGDRPAWFAAKRYGYGAGIPIAWQGWAILAGSLAIVVGVGYFFEDRPAVTFAILLPLIITLLVVAARTTRGGWRWRWGERD